VDLMKEFNSVAVVLFATVVIFFAQLTTNMAANVVSPSNDFSNLSPRRISYVGGGLMTAVIGIVMMPWKLMETAGNYVFVWLIGYSGLMGAIGGIMICDYWVLRRQRLELRALFDPRGRYSYNGAGVNWRAIVALVVAIAPCVPGFLDAATGGKVAAPQFFKTLYTYAWFITFAIGFVLYGVLMIGHPNLPRETTREETYAHAANR
jgi:NCS1 family nucleobase:cation symporter-1